MQCDLAKITIAFTAKPCHSGFVDGVVLLALTLLGASTMATLPDLSSKTHDELLAIIAALAATKSAAKLTLKVSEKGAISIYGLGRFPITLYKSQFDKLNEAWPEVQAFAKANAGRLTVKS
jgi:hypothetical protein